MKANLFICTRALLAVLATALMGTGCGDQDHNEGSAGGHKHGSAHGGVAVELGEHQFHLDVLHDPSVGVLKAWVMDAHVEEFVRIPAATMEVVIVQAGQTNAVTLQATANPSTGETVGNTSQFEGQSEALKGISRFTGTLPTVDIRGVVFRGVRFEYPEATSKP